MKKLLLLGLTGILVSALTLTGCLSADQGEDFSQIQLTETEVEIYQDGMYRGTHGDRGVQQISIQFHLEDNTISAVSFRHLAYNDNDYRQMEEDNPFYAIKQQHDQIIEYLEGKPLDAIYDLHNTENFIDDIDAFTGATIRGNKVFSAIKDALNRGVYVPAGEISREVKDYENGVYRGTHEDGGVQQISIQFHLEDNIISDVGFRHLAYNESDFLQMEEDAPFYAVKEQHEQIIEHLEGKPLEAMYDLFNTENFIDDIDAFTGATIRGNKVFSAIKDALNRGLYIPDGEIISDVKEYEDGRYRGIHGDGGKQQISIQFYLEDNYISDVSFRHLAYNENDYRQMEDDNFFYPIKEQHEQIIQYLEGKPLEAIYDLHNTENFIEDIDAFTGATIRGNKVFSAIKDGLNRGVY